MITVEDEEDNYSNLPTLSLESGFLLLPELEARALDDSVDNI